MTVILALSLVLQNEGHPGPIDGFRANYAAVKVDLNYTYRFGQAQSSSIVKSRLWDTHDFNLPEIQELSVNGDWSCDGVTEGVHYGSPADVAAEGLKKFKPVVGKNRIYYIPEYEAIYDGETVVSHGLGEHFKDGTLQASVGKIPADWNQSQGPFCWGWLYPFPQVLRRLFANVRPTRARIERGGHPTEVEIYRVEHPGDSYWSQMEISYDASVGYLPRFARYIMCFKGGAAAVREFYLVDAHPCRAGGFVPAEWYTASFDLKDFERTYPSYDHSTELNPVPRFGLGHFKASGVRDRSIDVGLERLQSVTAIFAPGGAFELKSTPAKLTMSEVKKTLGRALTDPVPVPMPALDRAELEEFTKPASRGWVGYAVAGGLILLTAGLFRRRLGRAAAGLLLLPLIGGCGNAFKPVTKLSATFTQTPVLYDINVSTIPMKLVVRNDGNRTLKVFKGDGGCACRRVDQSVFPATLRPGQRMVVAVEVEPKRSMTPEVLPFTFQTDAGTLPCSPVLYVLPRHQLSPDNPSFSTMNEGTPWEFEMVHRAVFEGSNPGPPAKLAVSREFEVLGSDAKTGAVSGSHGLRFRDTTYQVRLRDTSFGLHKAAFHLVGADGRSLLEPSIVWTRNPYLSSMPERVSLGNQPIRVFLLCPDGAVEFKRVVRAPEGVRAVVASPREVVVTFGGGPDTAIDGAVEMETSDDSHGVLRIPIVRFALERPKT